MASQLIKAITTDTNGFAVAITVTSPGTEPVVREVRGVAIRHHLVVDQLTGNTTSSQTARVTFHIDELKSKGLTRDIVRYKVAWIDEGTQELQTYIIRETMPGDTVGTIVCLLGKM